MLVALQPAATAAHHGRRQREMIVQVAVAHVAAEQDHGLIQHGALAVGHRLQLLHEGCEHTGVEHLHLREAVHLLLIVAMVREGMKCVLDPDESIRLVADLSRHHEGHDARQVRLQGKCHHVEHEPHVLVEAHRCRRGRIRQLRSGNVPVRDLLDAALDLANRSEIVVQHSVIAWTEVAAQIGCIAPYQIEHTAVCADQCDTLLGRIAPTEQLLKQLARVVLHRQRRRGSTEGNRLAVATAVVPVA